MAGVKPKKLSEIGFAKEREEEIRDICRTFNAQFIVEVDLPFKEWHECRQKNKLTK